MIPEHYSLSLRPQATFHGLEIGQWLGIMMNLFCFYFHYLHILRPQATFHGLENRTMAWNNDEFILFLFSLLTYICTLHTICTFDKIVTYAIWIR